MKKYLSAFALMLLAVTGIQAQIWRDPSQPLERRVADLLGSMTLEEKVSQLSNESPAIERLGIPEYNWWNEALHGVGRSGKATVFPQCIGLAATFDDDLIYRVASAISDEARAKFNIAQSIGNRGQYAGLTFWSPNINIFRDPRWGRGQETWGEDPYLTGRLASQFVRGMQGNDPNYLKVAACAKHLIAHSGPERLRHEFNAMPPMKDFYETYSPAFITLIQQANVESVMATYNRVFSEPCTGSPFLTMELLRDKWGFKGHVVSDCGALVDIYEGHQYKETPEEAAALALSAGVNLNCGPTYSNYLLKAINMGLATDDQVDFALKGMLRTRFKLGLFDPAGISPYAHLDEKTIDSPEHRRLAREAAAKSVVLLKNNNVLPLRKDARKYYVFGPNAASIDALIGNYYGMSADMRTLVEGVSGHVSPGTSIEYKHAILIDQPNVNPIDWSTGEAHTADAIILAMGITGLMEGEEGESLLTAHEGDRQKIELPQHQIDYLKKLRGMGDKPIILVLFGGSPLALGEAAELADAIVYAWYPGEEGGTAIADVLFGDVNPSGRLPITFPKSTAQLPPFEDYSMKGRTYRYMNDEPLYRFGYGLSYTEFTYSEAKVSASKIKRGEPVEVSVKVTNSGKTAGEEVVQLYVKRPNASVDAPLSSLKNFKRVALLPGETREVSFTVAPDMMAVVDDKGNALLEKGTVKLFVGGVSPGQANAVPGIAEPLEVMFTVK